jgi:O-antigen ligase
LILAGVLSGSIGVVRFLNLPYLTYIINHLWPIKGDQNLDILEWGRMETTVGGTNTGGVFFSILSVIILFKILTKNRRVYLNYFLLVFFVICTILTGSFTGVITFTISSIFLMLNLNPKPLKLFRFLLLGLTSTALFLNIPFVNEQLKGVIDKRYEENIVTMPEETYLPRSLHGRYYDWVGIAEVILSEKPFFGYGFILNNQTGANTTKFNPRYSLAENYYIQILVLSGLLGLIISIYFFYNIVLTVIKAKKYSYLDSIFVLSILLIYLFAQLTQITLQYSFLTFFFGILLANIHHLKISKCNTL